MSFWTVAHLQPQREQIALHCLKLAGFETYLPRLRERRVVRGRKVEVTSPLFIGYTFLRIELQWHAARRSVGVLDLIMDGFRPAHVADSIIDEIKGREVNGAIELLAPSPFRRGDRVQILQGPFQGQFAIYAGMKPRERVEVLLALLGATRLVVLPKRDIEAAVLTRS